MVSQVFCDVFVGLSLSARLYGIYQPSPKRGLVSVVDTGEHGTKIMLGGHDRLSDGNGHRKLTHAQNGSLQYSTGRFLPCFTMISDDEILGIASERWTCSALLATDALIACGSTTTGFDQITTVATTAAIATTE